MPGKVTAAHAELEEDCSRCHDRADRSRQRQLCLDCHDKVAADISERRGFHGKLTGIETSQCRACHSEHRGRDGDIARLSREQFDHSRTDFALRDSHANLPCESCHRPARPFRDAPADCHSCHHEQEPHAGKLGRNCDSCHGASAWGQLHFDHNKTAYPLRDRHSDVPCIQCHFGNRYKGTPQQCVSCHAPDDVHGGERGMKCADCHSTAGWKRTSFDHGTATGFVLEGVHAQIACHDCHRSGNVKDDLPRECSGCHHGEDAHAGRLGAGCGKCHDSLRWAAPTFDHARDTRWPLAGRHVKVDCHSCHTAATASQKLGTECVACHRANDVHGGRLGDCASCHTVEGWREDVRFDHDLTDFPLVGLHVAVPCEQCHVTRAYKDLGDECQACHAKEDVHRGGLGRDCARCHSPNGWRIWDFDHGKETGFTLSGAHAKLACADCHERPADQVKLDQQCVSCHSHDDEHLGQYGRQCQRCHSTVTFKGARVN